MFVPITWLVCSILTVEPSTQDLLNLFAMGGRANVMDEEHFGVINGKLTVGVNYKDAGSVSGLWSPPYVSSDFLLEAQVFGKKIPTDQYTWCIFQVERKGAIEGVAVSSATVLIPGLRAGVLRLAFENATPTQQELPLQFLVNGTLDRTDVWEFSRSLSKTPVSIIAQERTLILDQPTQAVVLKSNVDLQWDAATLCWKTLLLLASGERKVVHVAFAIGAKPDAATECEAIIADPEAAIDRARMEYAGRVRDLFEKLPRLESDNAALVRWYNRSLVHLLTNRWDVPEFLLHPYYSTGSMKGGCVCDYLWDFGEVWEILPLYDPQACREHIKQFLTIDITTHFAFMPITGEAFGPWYPVNQEKIIGLIYYYVKNTGDAAFLDDTVNGKSILEWAIANAMYGDDLSKPVALIDYGPSNSHLELRRGYPYNHVMPDLNGRRYANYRLAAELAERAGKPAPYLLERAAALKALLKQQLWNPEAKWFHFLDEKGQKDLRYTIQIFKLFSGGVLDDEEEAGLLSHLNETEFLSEQGLHSMSKTDIAYDQVDIDNGGGGNCTCFPPQIIERLYKSGHTDKAEDILRRILWWGERMPYWGDSLVANAVDYRRDTPLQCTLDGVTAAQCVIFGMFGVDVAPNGDITVNPHPPSFAPRIALTGLKLRGVNLDIIVENGEYQVETGGRTLGADIGTPVHIAK